MPSPTILLTGSTEAAIVKNKLKVYRATKDLTQEQLAQKVGISRQTVIAIEYNKYLPSLRLAFRFARLFNVSVEDIFEYDEKEDYAE